MIGIVVGYVVGAMTADAKQLGIEDYLTWRRAIFIQGIALYIIAFFFMCYPNHKLDILAEAERIAESGQQEQSKSSHRKLDEIKAVRDDQNICNDVLTLVSNPVYMSTMFVISCIYFSSTGLQFWTIQYMSIVLGADPVTAQMCFIGCALTAPIPGSLIGSYLADINGGYKGKFQVQALLQSCGFAFLGTFAGVALFFLYEIVTFTIGLFFLLLLGAAMFPTCFGIIISSVEKEKQNASSAFGQVFFNITGFWLAPNISGYVMDQYTNPKTGLTMGYRLLLGWNFFTLMFLTAATCFSWREYRIKY